MGKKKTHEEFMEDVKNKRDDWEEYEFLVDYAGARSPIEVKHICGKIYKVTPDNFISKKHRCRDCVIKARANSQRKSHTKFKEELIILVGSEYTVLSNYKKAHEKVGMRHEKCNFIYEVAPTDFLQGKRCPKCANNIRKSQNQFSKEVIKKLGNDYEILGNYKNSRTKIRMRHNRCGFEWEAYPHKLLKGSGCPKCTWEKLSLRYRKSHHKFVEEIREAVGSEYVLLDKYKNNTTKVLMLHNECGYEWNVTPKSFLLGNRCPKCRQSRGEALITKYLDNNFLIYQAQFRIDDCRGDSRSLPFDFAVFNQNRELLFLIEYDGKQHFIPVDVFGGEKGFKQRQKYDQIKSDYCKRNNIPLLRIPYWKFNDTPTVIDKFIKELRLPISDRKSENMVEEAPCG